MSSVGIKDPDLHMTSKQRHIPDVISMVATIYDAGPTLTLTTLKYFCINHGDQSAFAILKSSEIS